MPNFILWFESMFGLKYESAAVMKFYNKEYDTYNYKYVWLVCTYGCMIKYCDIYYESNSYIFEYDYLNHTKKLNNKNYNDYYYFDSSDIKFNFYEKDRINYINQYNVFKLYLINKNEYNVNLNKYKILTEYEILSNNTEDDFIVSNIDNLHVCNVYIYGPDKYIEQVNQLIIKNNDVINKIENEEENQNKKYYKCYTLNKLNEITDKYPFFKNKLSIDEINRYNNINLSLFEIITYSSWMYKNSFCKFYINVNIPKDYDNFINYKNVKIPKMINEFEDFMKFDNESAVISYYKNENIEYKVKWPYPTYFSLINYYIYEFIKIHNEYKNNITIYNESYNIFNGDFEHPKEYNFFIPYLNTTFNQLGTLKIFKPLTNDNYEDFIIKIKKHKREIIDTANIIIKWSGLNDNQICEINNIFEKILNKFVKKNNKKFNENTEEIKDEENLEENQDIIKKLYDIVKNISDKPELILDEDIEE